MSKEPTSYEEWKRCITVDCGIALTPKFIEERIAALNDDKEYHTQQFIKVWGSTRHSQTISWFQQAAEDLKSQKVS